MELRPLTINVDPSGLVCTSLNGDLSQERLPQLKEDVERANAFIKEQSGAAGRKLRSIVDLTNFSGVYVPDVMMVLAAYEKENSPYIEKTAGFGGQENVVFAAEIVSGLSRRDNISFFKTKEEALAWLNA